MKHCENCYDTDYINTIDIPTEWLCRKYYRSLSDAIELS